MESSCVGLSQLTEQDVQNFFLPNNLRNLTAVGHSVV